ncbi:MAG: DUF2911 domain-containing protein [Cyclobacteriaceae bacterium]
MKRKLSISVNLSLAIVFFASMAIAQISTPQPSPAGSVSATVGLTDVTIDYFRPKVKGRTIFGDKDALIPNGQMWRTGANSGSKLTLSTDAKIGGKDVKAGTYLILTVPGANEWQFILYSDVSLGGNVAGFKQENEVINVSAKASKGGFTEALTFNVADISEDNTSAAIELAWADLSVKVPIVVDYDKIVMADIAAKTKIPTGNYAAAANYYLSTGKDLNQALAWMDLFLAEGENSKQFWHVHTKAQILAKLGKTKEAIATAEQSKKIASEANSDFGYIKRNDDLIAEIKGK